MRFSWKSLLLAPLLVPVIASAVMAPLMQGEGSVFLSFLFLLMPACMVSYFATVFLFLPALFLLSLQWPVTGWMACALGFALGVALIVPIVVMAWGSSGPDSGPPVENFLTFAVRWAADPFMLVFPISGFVTAAFYWWLGGRSSRATVLASPEQTKA